MLTIFRKLKEDDSSTNEYQLTKEDVMKVDQFLIDIPAVAQSMLLALQQFSNTMREGIGNRPLEIEVLKDDGTTNENQTNSEVDYTYLVYPDAGGYYETGAGVVHGAQLLEDDQWQYKAEQKLKSARGFVITKPSIWKLGLGGGAWKKGCIPYFFSSGFFDSNNYQRREIVKNEMRAITQLMVDANGDSKIIFVDISSSTILLNVVWALGNFKGLAVCIDDEMSALGCSTVGRGRWRKLRYQSKTLDELKLSTIQHELCHVLGMKHEHQRDDRDQYIKVRRGSPYNEQNYGRIKWKYKFLFWTYFKSSNYGTPYDYNSIMHYSIDNGSDSSSIYGIKNPYHELRGLQGRTENNTKYANENGGTFLTPWDIYTIKRHYKISENPKPTYTPGMDILDFRTIKFFSPFVFPNITSVRMQYGTTEGVFGPAIPGISMVRSGDWLTLRQGFPPGIIYLRFLWSGGFQIADHWNIYPNIYSTDARNCEIKNGILTEISGK